MSFEQIGATDVATDGPAISMPGHVHDPAFADIIFRRRRHETSSQTVTAEVLNIEPDQAGVFLHNVADRLIGQSNGSNPTRAEQQDETRVLL